MDAGEAIRLTRRHIESKFPKTCAACGRRFENLPQYLRETKHEGAPVNFDEPGGRPKNAKPMGVVSFANCPCGAVLTINSDGMSLRTYWRLMSWSWMESRRRGVSWGALLSWVRAEIDKQALAGGKS